MFKIVKEPECEWEAEPKPIKATTLLDAEQESLEYSSAGGDRDGGNGTSRERFGDKREDGVAVAAAALGGNGWSRGSGSPAPGHGGVGASGVGAGGAMQAPPDLSGSLAYELD